MGKDMVSAQAWAERCAADGEFILAARFWNGGIRLQIGDSQLGLTLTDGQVSPGVPEQAQGVIEFAGSEGVWEGLLAQHPQRFFNDLMANIAMDQGLKLSADAVVRAQYYAAVMRAVELLRPPSPGAPLREGDTGPAARIDAPRGQYIHLDLAGLDHRIYFEQAGQGIPLLLQHTAGCHGSQWRHLFEMPEITERFQLIAYDLPFHGKSLPPVEGTWWSETYALRGEYLRSVPLQLARALNLERPVFMGCSVGGLLALDLAHKHADRFRAVISVEGALHIPGTAADLKELWHPQVNNEYKARLMDGLMAPSSPLPYRKETGFVYASGWPPAFQGDLYYYLDDYDLRACASQIDTDQVAVHILSGEYDYSGTAELGQAAHAAIAGSTWTMMKGVGHFPMSENPVEFSRYLLPVLDQIATG